MLKRKTSASDLKPGGVLAKCAKIALLARVLCIYPVVVGWADLGSISELLLVFVAVAGSTGLLLSWDRLSGFVRRHPSVVGMPPGVGPGSMRAAVPSMGTGFSILSRAAVSQR